MIREIVFDTETTGLDPAEGHRVVEIGCVELLNHVPTGRSFHRYLDPERDMPEEAFRVHGLGSDFLRGKPTFAREIEAFLAFIDRDAAGEPDPARLIAHNAAFDLRFLNAELTRAGRERLPNERLLDTLPLARSKFPGAPASLDALCRRFGLDAGSRTKHGALLDSELLAEVYLHLIGGRQPGLELAAVKRRAAAMRAERVARPPRPHAPDAGELAAWAALVERLAEPIWRRDGGAA